MKTILPERSLVIKPLLDRITSEILTAGKNTIVMIILFGSYARGDWVSDEYTEGHITYSYQSDLDIMVVLKKGKHIGYAEPRIEKRLEKELVLDLLSKKPWIIVTNQALYDIPSSLYIYLLIYEGNTFPVVTNDVPPLDWHYPISLLLYRTFFFHPYLS